MATGLVRRSAQRPAELSGELVQRIVREAEARLALAARTPDFRQLDIP